MHVTPSIFFRRILRSEALVYKSYFFRTAVLRKLFDIRFSYMITVIPHAFAYSSRKMASKTVTRSIKQLQVAITLVPYNLYPTLNSLTTKKKKEIESFKPIKVITFFTPPSLWIQTALDAISSPGLFPQKMGGAGKALGTRLPLMLREGILTAILLFSRPRLAVLPLKLNSPLGEIFILIGLVISGATVIDLCIGQIEASTCLPPRANPGHLTPLPSRGGGNLIIRVFQGVGNLISVR